MSSPTRPLLPNTTGERRRYYQQLHNTVVSSSSFPSKVDGLADDLFEMLLKKEQLDRNIFFEMRAEWVWETIYRVNKPIIVRSCANFVHLKSSTGGKYIMRSTIETILGSTVDQVFMNGKTEQTLDLAQFVSFAPHTSSQFPACILKEEFFIQHKHFYTALNVKSSCGSYYLPESFSAIKIWFIIRACEKLTSSVSDFEKNEWNVQHDGGRELISYACLQPHILVAITMPGDVMVLRAGDYYAVLTVYTKNSIERLAMAAGLTFYRRCDMNIALRYVTNFRSGQRHADQNSINSIVLYEICLKLFPATTPKDVKSDFLNVVRDVLEKEQLIDPKKAAAGRQSRIKTKQKKLVMLLNRAKKPTCPRKG